MKLNKQQQKEMEMFGETIEQFVKIKPSMVSNSMYAMMILSDAQEVIAQGRTEVGRQFINKAKYFISLEVKRERGE